MDTNELLYTIIKKLSSVEMEQQRMANLIEQLTEKQTELKQSIDNVEISQADVKAQSMKLSATTEKMETHLEETARCLGRFQIQLKNTIPPSRPMSLDNKSHIASGSKVTHLDIPVKPHSGSMLLKRNRRVQRHSSLGSNTEDENIRDEEFDRQCMAKAIKRNAVGIIGCMPFKHSSIPDRIIPSIATESECETMRNYGDRKDQIRTLIRAVTKRDYNAMTEFVTIVRSENANVSDAINITFQQLKEGRGENFIKTCTLCSIQNNVNIKDLYDYFYAKELITDELCWAISGSVSGIGEQNDLWNKLLLASSKIAGREQILTTIIGALEGKGPFFSFIINMLVRDIKRKRTLTCRCNGNETRYWSTVSLETNTSVSPRSTSPDSLSDDGPSP